MARRESIDCRYCGEWCGWMYPARTYGDPNDCYDSESEGPGENFTDSDGNWYCSRECLDAQTEQELGDEREE